MDITLNRDALADKLSEVVAIASRKATIPALNGVLIDAADKLASFSATDMEISARVACAAQVATPGRALLPAKRLNDIVRLLPNDSAVRIASDGASARIECGRYNSKLQTFSAEDFPSFPPAATDAKAIHVSGETVAALIRKVKHAAMGDTDVRYFLAGAFMILAGPRITLVATDGRRLAIASAARPNGPDASVLISSRVLSELTAMFEALRRVSLATTGNTRPVSFDVQKNGVKLVAASADVAEAVEHVDGAVKGGSVKVSLDSAAVLDFLDAAEPGKIVIELKDATTAALLRQVDERDTTYRCVVMPIVQATS
jgi:DNA polymerase-3 subunit beta